MMSNIIGVHVTVIIKKFGAEGFCQNDRIRKKVTRQDGRGDGSSFSFNLRLIPKRLGTQLIFGKDRRLVFRHQYFFVNCYLEWPISNGGFLSTYFCITF